MRRILIALTLVLVAASFSRSTAQTAAPSSVTQKIGAIKTIQGTSIQLTTDAGEQASIEVAANARVLRVPPGEKDLKNAVPAQLSELQVGDRILARGRADAGAGKLSATIIVVMKLEDVKTRQGLLQDDWQKRGSGGVVKSVDAASTTINIAGSTPGSLVAVHTSTQTIFKRYAPDSWKYDDAKPGTFQDIQVGDQLRARGNRSTDGKEITAEEIVSGFFRDLSGTVVSTDAAGGTFTLKDVQSKKTYTVKATSESKLLQVPALMAQRIAMRLKTGSTDTSAAAATPNVQQRPPAAAPPSDASNGAMQNHHQFSTMAGSGAGAGAGAGGGAGRGDIQQMLSHLPAIQLTDLHAGDAVMVLTTQGADEHVTAITLLSGVDAILRASPDSSQAINLGSWSLGSSAAEGAAP